jgi:hypothetical protein
VQKKRVAIISFDSQAVNVDNRKLNPHEDFPEDHPLITHLKKENRVPLQ